MDDAFYWSTNRDGMRKRGPPMNVLIHGWAFVTVDTHITEMTVAVFRMSALLRIGLQLKRSSV